MEISVMNNNNDVIIKPIGRLDSNTSGELEEKALPLITESISSLTVDMSEVDFVSSKCLRVLVTLYKALNGKDLNLTNVNNSVYEVLKLSGLLPSFKVIPHN